MRGNTTIINLNRQLPADLAQQQVNPVNLRGFSLPSGQNGLFRLSEDGASAQPAGQGHSHSQSWTMGGADIDLAQRQQALPENLGRTLQVEGAAQVAANTHQVVVAAREANGINVQARTVDASGVGNADAGIVLPGRTDSTRVDGITAGHSTGAPAVTGGGLYPADRDPRNLVTAPGSLPSLNVPGVSSADRDTRVGANQAGGLNLPGLTPLATTGPVSSANGPTLNRVQGLPGSKAVSQPHKYLIETNPVLTDLKQFMSSDYLLAGLGYNPDESAKRLMATSNAFSRWS
ncbi:hypothetical protein [Pseudomonas sp. 1152_12]|uniref:hypothetical protein n=1 Tax=Pseudomonas sp. 1152_12 TaxID=2604455 RepID=UPI004064456E